MSDPIISLQDVRKSFSQGRVLDGITLDVEAGDFFSLVGPSGCGKTTLLRAIAGFEDLSGGRLLIDGRDMAGVPAHRRPTNMVFQSYAIFPHLSVAENVGFGLRKRRESVADKVKMVEEALDMVGLSGLGDRSSNALSGGQRQRVALARALILKPRVLLLDEPMSALDKKLREQMQAELRRLHRQLGLTFILVTHDQEEALVMSDRIAVMFEGQVAQIDTPEALYRAPATRAVASFIGMMNFLPARAASGGLEIAGLGRAQGAVVPGVRSVGFRPETLSVSSSAPLDGRSAQGSIVDVAYYGDFTYYDISLAGLEAPLSVSMKNRPGADVLPVGASAWVEWDPRALVPFSE